MLVRIVKMSFSENEIDSFLLHFEAYKKAIRQSPGCLKLILYRDKTNPNIFFTYSHWESPDHLEIYRNSDLFKSVWSETKKMFNAKPEAWSLDKIVSLK